MTVYDALLSVSAYPIPERAIKATALKRVVDLEATADEVILKSAPFRLATADLYIWLFFAPDVEQGGQRYSFTNKQRELWWKQAIAIYEELGDEEALAGLQTQYGYMGSKL